MTEDTASGKYTDPLSLNKYTYCHNQPVTGYDPDGHALHILAGAVVGGLIGGAISYASQAWKNKSFTKGIDWKQVAGGAAEGAITGAIGAATGGASLAATAATSGLKTAGKLAVKKFAINTASGFVGNTANQLISSGGKSYDVKEAVKSGLTENIDIPAFQFGEKTAKKVGSEIVDKVGDSFKKKAGNEVAETAGAQSIKKTLGTSSDAGINSAGALPELNASNTKNVVPSSAPTINQSVVNKSNPRKRLPKSNGHWEGAVGDSLWISDIKDVNKITNGAGIPFVNGRPDFSQWSQGVIEFEQGVLDGTKKDFGRIYDRMKELSGGALTSRSKAREVLKKMGVTPHHYSDTQIQLIPSALHNNIPHIGSASDMRGGFN